MKKLPKPVPVYTRVRGKRVLAGTVFPPFTKDGDWECEEYIDGMSWGCETKQEAIELCRREFRQRLPELQERLEAAIEQAKAFNLI